MLTKQTAFILLFCIFQIAINAQIEFEAGYIINNDGQRVEVLIKNNDWRFNPDRILYRESANEEVKEATVEDLQEFGFQDGDKFIRERLQVDMSSNTAERLSIQPGPEWEEQTLFLKVVIEGKASLYAFESEKLIRFFYQVDEKPIEQLVYKRYYTERPKIRTNFQFRQQLTNNVSCGNSSNFDNLMYVKSSLRKVFISYNKCKDASFVDYNRNGDQLKFKGRLKAGTQAGRLTIDRVLNDSRLIHFDRAIGYRIGGELELILPFNRNKWSVVIEPTFQSNNSKGMEEGIIDLFDRKGELEYRSIEIPLGLRHTLFLTENWTLFIDAFYVSDIILKSYARLDGHADLENTRNADNFAAGLGVSFNDRFSAAFRYNGNRDIVRIASFYSDYNSYSLILGYRLF